MINLGKAIYSILSGSTTIYSVVNNRIYPIIAPAGTTAPFIIYERSTNADSTKDYNTIYNSNLDILIFTTDYKSGVELGENVINILNNYKGNILNLNIVSCNLSTIDEGYSEDKYMQKLAFTIRCQ